MVDYEPKQINTKEAGDEVGTRLPADEVHDTVDQGAQRVQVRPQERAVLGEVQVILTTLAPEVERP